MSRLVAGLFVGGRGERFGGRPKGLLVGPDGRPLIERLHGLLADAGADVVLVGAREPYASLGIEGLDDDPPGIGPLGGLRALLRRAGSGPALALACDLPFVSGALVARLVDAPPASIVAPRIGTRWEPLFARYAPARVLPVVDRLVAARRHALQALLDEAKAEALSLTSDEVLELRDWDRPEDMGLV
jgi:molybdopterin-guanine dinucleotide biosynthesis protein A